MSGLNRLEVLWALEPQESSGRGRSRLPLPTCWRVSVHTTARILALGFSYSPCRRLASVLPNNLSMPHCKSSNCPVMLKSLHCYRGGGLNTRIGIVIRERFALCSDALELRATSHTSQEP